ncbi:MAG: hypothetical protein J2P17_00170 [Mycobacterium sp.]|nr:hypothetical protein [Mycobacterium sp.]
MSEATASVQRAGALAYPVAGSEAGSLLCEAPEGVVPVPVPSTFSQISDWIGAVTGKDVMLAPWRTSASAPPKCAALIVVDGRIIIRYDARRSVRHRLQQIMHEVAHVLCGHLGRNAVSAGLVAGLDLMMIETVVQRHALEVEEERRAERVGTALALASRDVLRLDMAGWAWPWAPPSVADRIAAKRARVLMPLWEVLTDAAPEVTLGPIGPSTPDRFAAHRMIVEIEDAVMKLAPFLHLSAVDGPDSRARSVDGALARHRAGTRSPARGPSPWWPHDERAVLATAQAWTRLRKQ